MQTIAAVRPEDSVIVEEAPSSRPVMQTYLPIHRSGTFYTCSSGGLGHGLPAAIGVALAKTEQRVIGLIGDGSAMYAIQALWTASQLKLPMTFVIVNNQRYAALQDFASVFGFAPGQHPAGTELPEIDFTALARGQGCDACRVDRAEELEGTLGQAFKSTGPTLVEVRVA
jgi:benzoylformate decarboxylase